MEKILKTPTEARLFIERNQEYLPALEQWEIEENEKEKVKVHLNYEELLTMDLYHRLAIFMVNHKLKNL
jgi:hypothetical protein